MKKFDNKSVWNANVLEKNKNHWNYYLSNSEKVFFVKNVENIKDRETVSISKVDLVLNSAANQFKEDILSKLEDGFGFVFINGLADLFSKNSEYEKALWILGLILGKALAQSRNLEKDYIHKIEDDWYQLDDSEASGPNSNKELCFHSDGCDVTALMCIRSAKDDGTNKIVSSVMLNNFMYENHQDLLEELYKPYPFAKYEEISTTSKNIHYRPIIANVDEKIVCTALRDLIDETQKFSEANKLTRKQIKALDVFEELGNDSRFNLEFKLKPGEIVLFNNYSILHKRGDFIDYDDPKKKRLLLRLWLAVENSRKLHESYREVYGAIEPGSNRGGSRDGTSKS